MIGTLRESALHATLKKWYARPGDRFEVSVDGFFIDIQRGQALIEIQTRNFAALKRKLLILIERHPVRLIHPIATEKFIVRLGTNKAEPVRRRKSPRKGKLEDIFSELVSLPDLIAHPNFTLEVALTREEEIQKRGRGGSWRRKGWKIVDRVLLDVIDATVFESPADFRRFLPEGLPTPFTTTDLAHHGHYPRYLAQKMTYCLRRMGALGVVGKRRNAVLYAWRSFVR
jgi:hypothetical protein